MWLFTQNLAKRPRKVDFIALLSERYFSQTKELSAFCNHHISAENTF